MATADNKRILKNTMFLYLRMLLVMGVSLYTSRVILEALGFKDYGLYNVIGGFVGLFSVLTGSLSAAISRYLTFELGTGNIEKLKKIFSCSLFIQLSFCFIIIILSSTIGVWFINNKMEIPDGSYKAAYWIFGFSVVSFCLSLLSVPYNATIIANEKMSTFSYVSIVEVALKLAIAFSISLFSKDKVIYYALMLFIVSVIIQLVYMTYCWHTFIECRTIAKYDKFCVKEIGKFAGWNFIGAASAVLRSQGNNVILNLFYGTVVNAAYGISMQVSNAITQLSNNLMMAVNPQITKLYAKGESAEMHKLIIRSAKMSFYLCWIISIIILFNTSEILTIWLNKIPEYTVVLVQLVTIFILCESFSTPLITAMLATGNIRNYQIIVGGLQMLNLPISYILLRNGFKPPCVWFVAIIISQLCLCARLILLRKMINLKVRIFLKEVVFKACAVVFISSIIPFYIKIYYPEENISILLMQIIVCFLCGVFAIYFIGFNKHERTFILQQISSLKKKLISYDKN